LAAGGWEDPDVPAANSQRPVAIPLKILSAEFVTSAARAGGIPADGLGQIAVAGRSNVGKSTLLNALVRRKLARTSAAPGKTRLANIFRVTVEGGPGGPGHWGLYLVDLPGYGYARGGSDAAKELAQVAQEYFAVATGDKRQGISDDASRQPPAASRFAARPPRTTLLLVDSRHPGLDLDIQAHRWLTTVSGPPQIVATKIDKLSRSERAKNLKELERVFGSAPLPVSAAGGEGLDELWKLIARVVRTTGR
jgi:GTP-binding protein